MEVTTTYNTYKKCKLYTDSYYADNSLFIGIMTEDEGYPEPLADITVCIPDSIYSLKENEAYVDTNNCPWVLDFIRQYELGTELGITCNSGYCFYPVIKFNMDKVKELSA